MDRRLFALLLGCNALLIGTAADARSAYDGSWNVTFVTQSGDCDTYTYTVSIENGVISSANVDSFKGSVTSSGAVRASVTFQEKHASGAGKLTGVVGRGTWTGYSGDQRCTGSWTAQRAW